MSEAPTGSEVVIETTFGWYWPPIFSKTSAMSCTLANPHGNDWGHRRLKNDERDARELPDSYEHRFEVAAAPN